MKTISLKSLSLAAVVFLQAGLIAHAATIITNTFNSSSTWQVPAGVTTVDIYTWGAGGGSGGSTNSGAQARVAGGGGGAGGAFAGATTVSVTAGDIYTINVGAGGTAGVGGIAGTGGTGGSSYVSNNMPSGLKVLAQGGAGGGNGTLSGTTPNQGVGGLGSTSSSVGTTLYAGGNGGTAINPNSGSGGGGAGSGGPGGNGSSSNPAAPGGTGGTPDGGTGGAGRINANPGTVGNALGGGAGGGKVGNTITGTQPGAAGGAGRVMLVYTIPFNTLTWIGDGAANLWNTNSGNTSWDSNADNAADTGFTDGDLAIFSDAGVANPNVTLAGRVAPLSVTVNAASTYNLAGSGWISGVASLTKSGTGVLTVSTANDYTGGTTISGGGLRVDNNAALSDGQISIGGGALYSSGGTPRTFSNRLLVTGASTLGDAIDNGTLTFTNVINFNGASRAITNFSDVIFAGGSTNGQLGSKSGPATLTLKGTFNYGGASDVLEGTEIIDGATVTNTDRLIADATSGRLARLVITNGAKIISTGTANNLRAGRVGAADGTNIVQLAGVYRTDNSVDPNGYATLYRGCAWAEIDFLTGGDYAAFAVTNSGSGSGYSLVVFDGGFLRARSNNAAFMQGLSEASVRAGGANIDDGGFAITINQALQNGGGGGGLTKHGAGSLTLGGVNTYTGNTVISNGTLIVTTGSLTGGGGLIVRDGAKLNIMNAASSLTVSSLTLGSAGATTLEFGFPSGNPGAPTLAASSVTANGPVTINITGAGFVPGTITLIQSSGAISGLGNFVLGTKPAGMSATLVTSANSVSLNISSVSSSLLWTGNTDNNWNTGTINWLNQTLSGNSTYAQGDSVTFDSASAQPNVNLALSVTPFAMTVNSGAYSFAGPGKISGAGSVTVNSGATVTLATINDYSGGTVNSGQLVAGADQAFGSGTVVLNTGSQLRSDSSTARTLTNVFTLTADDVNLGDASNPGTLTLGTINFGGSTTRALNAQSDVVIANAFTNGAWKSKNGPGTLVLKASYQQSILFNHNQGDVIIDGASFDNGNGWRVMNTTGGTSRLIVTNCGTMTMTAVATGNFRVGNAGGDNTSAINIMDVSGTINLLTTNPVSNSAIIVGGSGVSDILNLRAGGNLIVRAITGSTPGNTEAHFYGGTLTALATDAGFINGLTNAVLETGSLTIDSASFTLTIPQPLSGSGGLTKTGSGRLVLDGANTYTGTTLVSQGTLGGNGVISGPVSLASSTTLAPGSASTIGTLTISNNLTLNSGSSVSVQVNKDDLTKDLVTGLVNVNYNGTLLVTNIGGNALTGGETFQLFSASGTQSGNFASVVIQNSTGITNGTFNPATGTLTIGSTIPTTPTNLTYSVSGGVITLQWPANYLGWSLQVQTNPVSIGLSTNWVTIPGSASVTSTNLPVVTANGAVFYRMVYQP